MTTTRIKVPCAKYLILKGGEYAWSEIPSYFSTNSSRVTGHWSSPISCLPVSTHRFSSRFASWPAFPTKREGGSASFTSSRKLPRASSLAPLNRHAPHTSLDHFIFTIFWKG